MKEFIFKIDNNVVYHGNLVSSQCTAHSKAGSRCKRRCVIGIPFCYTHLFVTHIYYIIIIYVLKKVQFLKLD